MKRKQQSPPVQPLLSASTERQTRVVRNYRVPSNSIDPLLSPTASVLQLPSTPSRWNITNNQRSGEPSVSQSGLKKISLRNAPDTPQRTAAERVRFAPDGNGTTVSSPPVVVTNADRSARRKSVRRIIARSGDDDASDDDDARDEEEQLARRIYGSASEDDDEGILKHETKRRGRPKKQREPTPPPTTLEGPDSYFHQNRKTQQTSTSTLASLPQLDHSKYFDLLRHYSVSDDLHTADRVHLYRLHALNFPQWKFELSQGFNLLLYGYGSKRKLIHSIAQSIYTAPGNIVIINGYLPSLTAKEILQTITSAALSTTSGTTGIAGSTATSILPLLKKPLTLLINNLDGPALRTARMQTLLSQLAAHPYVSVVATVDHIRAAQLWDAARSSQFNFLWHDATTFEPYTVEIPADDILSLVDGAGRAGGARGVKYVLASLPRNAKTLFGILVKLQLQAMAEASVGEEQGKKVVVDAGEYCVEYRSLYQRAVSEFVCSNDVAFRTLMKEYVFLLPSS
jgi:origin recognition complex subunit 2